MDKTISLEDARQYLDQLDLKYLIDTMCAEAYPLPRWEISEAIICSRLYKNFLFLQKKHLPEMLVPTRQIDEFWHNHILYTKKYFHDCLHIFGHYLHHDPVIPGQADALLINAYLQTKTYYLAEFGHDLEIVP